MSSNWNRKPKDDIINFITDELDHFNCEAIESGLQRLLREEVHYPSTATMIRYVGQEQGKFNLNSPIAELPEPEPSDNDRVMTHLFLQLLTEDTRKGINRHYIDMLDIIGKRALAKGLPVEIVDSKMNKMLKIYRDEEKSYRKYAI